MSQVGAKCIWDNPEGRAAGWVPLRDLTAHMKEGKPDTEFAELQAFPFDRDETYSFADQHPEKNRYANIRPYDSARVRIPSGYINASRMASDTIATQSPLVDYPAAAQVDTRSDFWEMVWDREARTIIALTGDHEIAAGRASLYWPKSGVQVYGRYKVEFVRTLPATEGIVHRVLSLSRGSEPPRTVHHFQYTEWPDWGVPAGTATMRSLVEEALPSPSDARSGLVTESGSPIPVIVHCSAGIGRAGTFLLIRDAIRAILAQSRQGDDPCVNMSELLAKLRHARPGMVQKVEQYRFAYEAVRDEAVARGLIPAEATGCRADPRYNWESVGSWYF
jgi:receptor-type tyrosine-protein phosphatase A